MTSAIPTRYAGVQFRSRLEARWAAFFDLVGWRWEYEPIDLDGYIPDFLVTSPRERAPTLVEVKPINHWPCAVTACVSCNPRDSEDRALHDLALAKVRSSGWSGLALLVGAVLMPPRCCGVPRIGRAPQFGGPDGRAELWPDMLVVQCSRCAAWRIGHDAPEALAEPGLCCDIVDRCGVAFDPTEIWREAGNRVQWRAPKGGR